MITCTFDGGLGNNIFQLANIISLHKSYNVAYEIPNTVCRNTHEKSQALEFKNLFDNNFNYNNVNHASYKTYVHLDMLAKDPIFHYKEYTFQDNTSYSGYFQSEKYFNNVDIKNEFVLNQNIVKDLQQHEAFKKPTIAIHYRLGGDRPLLQHLFTNVSLDFYKKSLDILTKDLSDYNLLLFSDNINGAAELLKDYPVIKMELQSNIHDFIAMSLCDYNILGNSTFSWWAAYLNKKNKKTIAPYTEWFGAGFSHFIKDDLFPKEWITI